MAIKKPIKNYVVERASAGGTDGSYTSRSGPAAAASKAATKRFTSKVTAVKITVRETGTDKLFTYNIKRVKLPKPFVTVIKGKEIVRKYKTVCKAAK